MGNETPEQEYRIRVLEQKLENALKQAGKERETCKKKTEQLLKVRTERDDATERAVGLQEALRLERRKVKRLEDSVDIAQAGACLGGTRLLELNKLKARGWWARLRNLDA